MFPANHKTVFVLDHTPYFGIASGNVHEFEYLMQNHNEAQYPVPAISKPLWTCCVETVIEYCRIVWDLYPTGKLLRFISSDSIANLLNTWDQQTQTMLHISNAMSLIGGPAPSVPANVDVNSLSVIHGLRAGIESLSELTDLQKKYLLSQNDIPLQNNARLICITCARDDDSIQGLVDIFVKVLEAQNSMAKKNKIHDSGGYIIHHCHFVIINVGPNNAESMVHDHPLKDVHSNVSYEVHSIKAKKLHLKFSHLIQSHYNLSSTTITGIPMKEEQSSASSANYDVEIYHATCAHDSIYNDCIIDTSAIKAFKEGNDYETITLRWCTPRGYSTADMLDCTAVVRFTTVDVNSRPSTCLTNFLLNGRSVMLETPKKNGKIISHLLTSHGGELFIHALNIGRSVLESMPSISECCGGRVTDYRVNEFAELMKRNRMVACKKSKHGELSRDAISYANSIKKIDVQTKYWPITYSSTLIYNLKSHISPLVNVISQETLSDQQIMQCKQVIFNLIGMEAKYESLPLSNAGVKFKGQRRDEQYKFLWSELETLCKSYCTTENHKAVYNCILESRKAAGLEDFPRASVIHAMADSPLSPPGIASNQSGEYSKNQFYYDDENAPTLYDWFMGAMNKKIKQRGEMDGRKAGSKFRLYSNLEENRQAALNAINKANSGGDKRNGKDKE